MLRPLRGAHHPRAKLSWTAVREIRRRYAAGASLRQLAVAYGVVWPTIQALVHYRTWWPDPATPAAPRPPLADYRPRRRWGTERPANARLTWLQVRAIRTRVGQGGACTRELATEYSVSPRIIQAVVAYERYWPEPGLTDTPRPAPLQAPRMRGRSRGESVEDEQIAATGRAIRRRRCSR